jgi:hypothetical protein
VVDSIEVDTVLGGTAQDIQVMMTVLVQRMGVLWVVDPATLELVGSRAVNWDLYSIPDVAPRLLPVRY